MDGSEIITDINVFAYTHSGTTYLLNILLELNVCIYRGDFNTFWKKETSNCFTLNPKEKIDLGVWFPKFQTTSEFKFNPSHRVRWSHTFPKENEVSNQTILVVRDPRDVMLSFAARVAQHITVDDFLHRPLKDPLPHVVSLYPTEDWSIYNLLISKIISPEKLCVVRFEDLRENPCGEMVRVLDFLEISFDRQTLKTAIEKSSHTNVKQAADHWYELYPHLQSGSWKSLSRGKVGDWEGTYSEKELSFFTGLPAFALREFGYTSSTPSEKQTSLRKEAACNLWVKELFGKECNSALATKTLNAFLEITPHMVNRPLIIIATARGLAHEKNHTEAHRLLDYVSTIPDLHYYEQIELGKCYLELNDPKSASKLFTRASKCLPHKDEVYNTTRDLIKNKHYMSAIAFFIEVIYAD
jgi:hypothetical protein